MANLPNLSHSGNKTNKQNTAIRLVSQIPLSLREETMSCAKSYCCSKFKKIMVIVICESVVLMNLVFTKGLHPGCGILVVIEFILKDLKEDD